MVDDMTTSSPSIPSSSASDGDGLSPATTTTTATAATAAPTTHLRKPRIGRRELRKIQLRRILNEASSPRTEQSSTSTPQGPRRRRPRRPAKGSLVDIIHQHAGKTLFVRPICWTDLHTRLLGAQFSELPPCDTPLPCTMPGSPPTQGHMRPSMTITVLSNTLTQILLPCAVHPTTNSTAVALMTLWPTAFSRPLLLPELHVFFDGKVHHDIMRVQVMWNFPPDAPGSSSQISTKTVSTRPADSPGLPSSSPGVHNPANLPMLCYVGKKHLAAIREKLFRIPSGPGNSWNEPVFRLQRLRAKLLSPADSDRDAHFVSIFLAMAQRHFYAPPEASVRRKSSLQVKPPRPDFQPVKLRILTHDNDTSEFLVYTGYVTAKFLARFHDPCDAPCSDDGTEVPGIKIEYTRVPIWPILGLRERLGKALGEEVVGHFDPNSMETWEDDDLEASHSRGKRKRDALTEVLNGSFDEESGDEETKVDEKKRCLSEGSRMGVVA